MSPVNDGQSMINWGIISTGNIAHSFAKDFKYSTGGNLVAVASRSIHKANDFGQKYSIPRRYSSYEELFLDKDIDAVYIATPHNFHFDNSCDAINNGKAVLCEKPITTNPQHCNTLIELSKSKKIYLMEAMWTFFLPPIRKAIEWVQEGKIGHIKNVTAEFGFRAEFDPQSRLFAPELAGGALLDIGIYPIALCYLVYQQSPGRIRVNAQKARTGVDHEESMVFSYSNGKEARLHATLLTELPNEAEIIGEKGFIKIPNFFQARECTLSVKNKIVAHFVDDRKSVGYNYEISAVNRDLTTGKIESEIVPLETSLAIQDIIASVMAQF